MKSAPLNQTAKVDMVPVSGDTNRPFRISYFDDTAMLGGGEIALLNLVRYVDRKRITPVVVLCSDGPLADRLRDMCEVHILSLHEAVRKTKKDNLVWGSFLKLRDVAAVVFCSFRLSRFAVKHDVDL